jgi:hypothetical protein
MLTPVTVDGGFPISRVLSDSVGIIYPGERVDLILDWKPTSNQNSPELLVSLDPESEALSLHRMVTNLHV